MLRVVCLYIYIYNYVSVLVSRDHDSQPLGCEWATRSRVGLWAVTGLGRNPKPNSKPPCIYIPPFPTFPHFTHTNTPQTLSLLETLNNTPQSLSIFGSSKDPGQGLGQDH